MLVHLFNESLLYYRRSGWGVEFYPIWIQSCEGAGGQCITPVLYLLDGNEIGVNCREGG